MVLPEGRRVIASVLPRSAGPGTFGRGLRLPGADRQQRRQDEEATRACASVAAVLGRRQLMNYSFNSLHIVNTYWAFGSVTRSRDEVVERRSPVQRHCPDCATLLKRVRSRLGMASRRDKAVRRPPRLGGAAPGYAGH